MGRTLSAAVVVLGTALLVAASRRALINARSHGFFRFFAFEAILCLVVLNAPSWFQRPAAPNQLASWALLATSLLLAIHALHLLGRFGRPTVPAAGSPLYRIENTTAIITIGAYRYIRHPLYASALVGAWGAVLKDLSPVAIALGLLATVFLVATAKAEEAENLDRFGEPYREYMTRTRLFIPFVC